MGIRMVLKHTTNDTDTHDEVKIGKRADTSVAVDEVNHVTRRPSAGKHRAKPKPAPVTPVRGRHKAVAPVTDPVNIDFLAPRPVKGQHIKSGTSKNPTILAATTGGILLAAISAATSSVASQSDGKKSVDTNTSSTKILTEENSEELNKPVKVPAKSKISYDRPEVETIKAPPPVVIPPKPAAPPAIAEATTTQVAAPQLPGAPPVALGSVWDKLAACESSGHWNINTGNGYFGGLQFSLQTWQAFGGIGNPADATREQQIMIAEKVLKVQGWNAWPSCSMHLGLNGIQPEAATTPAPKIITKTPVQTIKSAPAPQVPIVASGKAAIIHQAALSQIGRFQDCTALATNSLAAAGIVFHDWPAGYLSLGTQVSAAQAIPGDLIYYANGGMGVAHIAVYIGGGQAVHGGWNGNQTVIFSSNVGSGPVFIRVA
jgi:hypothetical protein